MGQISYSQQTTNNWKSVESIWEKFGHVIMAPQCSKVFVSEE